MNRYEVIGPKGVILASGLTKRQADTYCANCGGTVRAENPAPKRAKKNPLQKGIVKFDDGETQNYRYHVEYKMPAGDIWHKHAAFNDSSEAIAFARSHARKHPVRTYRVVDQFV